MGNLVVEEDIEMGAVHLQPLVQPAVVLNEALVAELIQKKLTRERVVPIISASVS